MTGGTSSESPVLRADRPQALNPEPKGEAKNHSLFSMAGASNIPLGIALLGTALGLSAVVPSDDIGPELHGKCSYGEPDSAIQSPCSNVTVNLLDEDGKIATSASTNRYGIFRFYIPDGQSYYVQVLDRKGRKATTQFKAGRSKIVSLFLKP